MNRRPSLFLLLLALAGAILVFVATFIPYAQLSIGTESGLTLKVVDFDHFKESWWAGLQPLALAIGTVLAVTVVYVRSTAVASGLLMGFGVAAFFLYFDSIGFVASSGSEWDFREGNFLGMFGALMILATGIAALLGSRERITSAQAAAPDLSS